MNINQNIMPTLKAQYLQPGETPEDMLKRVANFIASGEKDLLKGERDELAEHYFETMNEGYWLPSSPFLMNAGTKNPMLFACFVQGVEDSMESIFESLKRSAIIHKMGGGTGFDFSPLRAKDTPIKSTGGTSSGVVSFIELFDKESDLVKQGGRRRAANMGVLRVDHPDILEFIDAKKDLNRFNNFNFSIAIPDWFMRAVPDNHSYALRDHENRITGFLNAGDVYKRIIHNNWCSGEPGMLFIDNINDANPVPELGDLKATNPCGEEPLLPNESCDLASLNLSKFVEDGELNTHKLKEIVFLMTRFLDAAIEVNAYPNPDIEKAVKLTRKIGIGVMGLHGALIKLGYSYNSSLGRGVAEKIQSKIQEFAVEATESLAKEKGPALAWNKSIYKDQAPRRNMYLLTIAPTGTISMILDADSSGVEPIFMLAYKRLTRGAEYTWVNPLFDKIGREEGWLTEEVMAKVIANRGRATGITEIPLEWQKLFVTAEEISPADHLLMQSVLQRHVDASISKTINMPSTATEEDLADIFTSAWKRDCKGVTIYRSGSREGVLNAITTDKDKKSQPEAPKTKEDLIDLSKLTAEEIKNMRPKYLFGVTTKVQSGCGKLWITINSFKGGIWEIFASSGADGGCNANIQESARLVSLSFRRGISAEEIVDQLHSVTCPMAIANKKAHCKSCADALGKQIDEFLKLFNLTEWDKVTSGLFNEEGQVSDGAIKVNSGTIPEAKPTLQEQSDEELLEQASKMTGCRSGKCL